MPHTKFYIDGSSANPACARFIFQKTPTPGKHEYELWLHVDEACSEALDFAGFRVGECPSESVQRDWMFWLGHIISRLHDPNECIESSWVINNITRVSKDNDMILFYGVCSPWIDLS